MANATATYERMREEREGIEEAGAVAEVVEAVAIHRRRILRSRAMWRFAAALPFTILA